MAEVYSINEIRNGGTYKVDTTTIEALNNKLPSIVGKVVALTGDFQVGFGSPGDMPLGIVGQIENENTNSPDFVVSVLWHTGVDEVPYTGSVTAGDFLSCDGKGGVQKETSKETKAQVQFVNAENTTCGVYFN